MVIIIIINNSMGPQTLCQMMARMAQMAQMARMGWPRRTLSLFSIREFNRLRDYPDGVTKVPSC